MDSGIRLCKAKPAFVPFDFKPALLFNPSQFYGCPRQNLEHVCANWRAGYPSGAAYLCVIIGTIEILGNGITQHRNMGTLFRCIRRAIPDSGSVSRVQWQAMFMSSTPWRGHRWIGSAGPSSTSFTVLHWMRGRNSLARVSLKK